MVTVKESLIFSGQNPTGRYYTSHRQFHDLQMNQQASLELEETNIQSDMIQE